MKKSLADPATAGSSHAVVNSTARVLDRKQAVEQVIARRAYAIFEDAGREDGHSVEHWLRAEAEMLRAVPVDVSEAAAEVLVRAAVPGFRPDDLAIAVEPGRLLIAGQKDASVENVGREPVAQCGDQFFCVADVPRAVDSTGVRAWLEEGVLRVVLPTMPPPSDARHEPAPAR